MITYKFPAEREKDLDYICLGHLVQQKEDCFKCRVENAENQCCEDYVPVLVNRLVEVRKR